MAQGQPIVETFCPECHGQVKIAAESVQLETEVAGSHRLCFRCPNCGSQARKAISERAVRLLQLVPAVAQAPAEVHEHRSGPPLTALDLIRFKAFLDTCDHLAALAGGLADPGPNGKP